jgi:hypothetical protein
MIQMQQCITLAALLAHSDRSVARCAELHLQALCYAPKGVEHSYDMEWTHLSSRPDGLPCSIYHIPLMSSSRSAIVIF